MGNPTNSKKSKGDKDSTYTLTNLCEDVTKAVGGVQVVHNPATLMSDVQRWVPTGILPLDMSLGGGIPCGRVILVYGRESSGKTTLATQVMAAFQAIGGVVVLFDSEGTFELKRAVTVFCIDKTKLIPVIPKEITFKVEGKSKKRIALTIDNVFDVIHEMVEKLSKLKPRPPVLFVWDTLSSSPTLKELEEDSDSMGYRARTLRSEFRTLGVKLQHYDATFMVLAHTSTDLKSGYDQPSEGGGAFKFHSSIRIQTRKIGNVETPYGNGISIKCVPTKNKVGVPNREAVLTLLFNSGINPALSVLDTLIQHKKIEKKQSWYYLDKKFDEKAFHYNDWPELVSQNPEIWEFYSNMLREVMNAA